MIEVSWDERGNKVSFLLMIYSEAMWKESPWRGSNQPHLMAR